MRISWPLIGLTWLYEAVVFIFFVTLSLIGPWEGQVHTHPDVLKWLFLIAVILNGGLFLYLAFPVMGAGLNRDKHTWHFGLATWCWAWPTYGAWWWTTNAGFCASCTTFASSIEIHSYILWKAVLATAVVAAIAVTVSGVDLVRTKFETIRTKRAPVGGQ